MEELRIAVQEEKITKNYEDYYPTLQPQTNFSTERGGSRDKRGFDEFLKNNDKLDLNDLN